MASLSAPVKRHGEVNYTLQSPIAYNMVDKARPDHGRHGRLRHHRRGLLRHDLCQEPGGQGAGHIRIPDTATARGGVGGSHVGEVVPQIWSYEHTLPGGQPARAFVWMQGHYLQQHQPPRHYGTWCCAASPGPASARSMSWSTTGRPRPAADAAAAARRAVRRPAAAAARPALRRGGWRGPRWRRTGELRPSPRSARGLRFGV